MDWRKVMPTTPDKEKILKLFREEGLTVRQLKERFNTTAARIREIIKKGGMSTGLRKASKKEGSQV
ncbi:MAG: hypothetical protein A4E57_03212 [Syntrophorhabdaceae bacterium PtaU1.Bin034]|nr:MAG: hypothetical protein A4E57_03212 [Syntrophorhabdaceae bacterium PtaU1.Bin034]